MSEKISGLVEIQESKAPADVQIVLSGDDASGRFGPTEDNGPATTISPRSVTIGRVRRKAGASTGGVVGSSGVLGEVIKSSTLGSVTGVNLPGSTTGTGNQEVLDDRFLPKIMLTIGDADLEGGISVIGKSGSEVLRLNGATAGLVVGGSGNSGEIVVFNSAGQERIRIDGASGDIKLLGADCAEEFEILDTETLVEPGTVMVIQEGNTLRASFGAYDSRVAGVISGAGDYRPGIVLGKLATQARRHAIALVGKTFCKVDAHYSPISVGDLLTTSDTPGYAMKVVDPARAFGAVIGKALRPLAEGQGLIPILIALQ